MALLSDFISAHHSSFDNETARAQNQFANLTIGVARLAAVAGQIGKERRPLHSESDFAGHERLRVSLPFFVTYPDRARGMGPPDPRRVRPLRGLKFPRAGAEHLPYA